MPTLSLGAVAACAACNPPPPPRRRPVFSATDWVVVWCIPTLLARRGKIPLVAEYGDKVAAAVSSAALEQPGAGMLAVVGGGLRRQQ